MIFAFFGGFAFYSERRLDARYATVRCALNLEVKKER